MAASLVVATRASEGRRADRRPAAASGVPARSTGTLDPMSFDLDAESAAAAAESPTPSAGPTPEAETDVTAIGMLTGGTGSEALAQVPEEALADVDRLLDEVEQRLAALDDGSYGRCTSCGAAIEAARLTEDPLAIQCGSCRAGSSPPDEF